jgi:hypothetical protein
LEISQSQKMSMPIDLALARAVWKDVRFAKASHSSAVMSKTSPSLARNSITSATASG